jgi:hypothetical protein
MTSRYTEFLAALGTKIIQLSGVDLPRRKTLNFAGTGVTVVDNSASDRTDVTITAGGGSSDHGALTGLGDNDHPQYALLAGAGPTGTFTWTSGNVSVLAGTVTGTNIQRGAGAPTGSATKGTIYQRTDDTGQIYRNTDGATAWTEVSAGSIPTAYGSTPENAGGAGGAGASANFARGDHKHDSGTLGAAIASATTTDIGAATGDYVHITGTTTITSFGTGGANGCARTLCFDGAVLLTHSASLILPAGSNVTTVAGETAIFRRESSGVWRCVAYPPRWNP